MGEERGAVMWLIFFRSVPVVGIGLTGMLAPAFAGRSARATQACYIQKIKPTHCAVWRAENEPVVRRWEPAETL